MKTLLELFLAFARVGVMTFGGGYAMLPILEREVVEDRGWATHEELMEKNGAYKLLHDAQNLLYGVD